MKKKIVVVSLVLSIVMLLLQVSAVFAVSPIIEVSGTIDSSGAPVTTKFVGGNRFMSVQTISTWDGGIDGGTLGSQSWITHTGGKKTSTNIKAELVFETATVDGKTGGLIIQLNLKAEWGKMNYGTWVIKDASGGLEGLHGGGIWIYQAGVINEYVGGFHFKP